jgi:hypothetical protein
MGCTLLYNTCKGAGVIAHTKVALLSVIQNPKSTPDAVHDAFSRLYTAADADRDFLNAVETLCVNHPEVAKGFLVMMPERFIPKGDAFAVDGYIP